MAIPTFTSTAVSQIPSMGIVAMSGDKAKAQAFEGVAGTFDNIAKMYNEQANQEMKFEMQKQGVETAMQRGFDPATLKDPVTTADRIYRESAINTYAAKLENDVSSNLDKMYLNNQKNPAKFKAEAEAYLNSTAENVPHELKSSVIQYGGSKASKYGLSIAMDVQRQVLAENEKANEVLREIKVQRAATAKDPAEQEVAVKALVANIDNDTSIMTVAGKDALKMQYIEKIERNSALQSVYEGDLSPAEAIEDLNKKGIFVPPEEAGRLISSFQVKDRETEIFNNRKETAQAARLNAMTSEYASMAYEMSKDETLSPEQKRSAVSDMAETLLNNGMDVSHIQTFTKNMNAIASNGFNPEVSTEMIEAAIVRGINERTPGTDALITQLQSVDPVKAAKYTNDWKVAMNTQLDATAFVAVENRVMRDYAPLANANAGDYAGDVEMQARIAKDKNFRQNFRQEATKLLDGRTVEEVAQTMANSYRDKGKGRIPVPVTSKNYTKLDTVLNSEDLTIFDVKTKKNITSKEYPFLAGPWTAGNKGQRIKLMIRQNDLASKKGIPPYSDEFLMELLQGLKDAGISAE